jgi:hypothetical protein
MDTLLAVQKQRQPRWKSSLLAVLIAIVFIAVSYRLVTANLEFSQQNPGGNDFLARWMGAKYFLAGVSPYDDRVGLATQQIIYGHAAIPTQGEDLERFIYPLYSMLIFAPFALFDFPLARALWMTLEEMALLGILFLSLRAARHTPVLGLVAVWMFFALTWYMAVRAVINGNPIVFVALFLTGSVFALQRGNYFVGGVLLALATIKPQVTLLCIAWILLWSFFHRKSPVWIGFFISMALLIGGGMIFQPDWILADVREIIQYSSYTAAATPASTFPIIFPTWGFVLGWVMALAAWIGIGFFWRKMRNADEDGMNWTAWLTLALGAWSGIPNDAGNHLILFPAFVLILVGWNRNVGASTRRELAVLVILWISLWGFFLLTLQEGDQPMQHPAMFFPIPLFCILGLISTWKNFRSNDKGIPGDLNTS